MAKTSRAARVAVPHSLLFLVACALAIAGVAQAQTYSVLHTFQYFPNGASPYAPLYRDASGNLYGTASGGGPYNAGVVFKLDTAGNHMVLHTFTGGTDGGTPGAGVAMDSAGNLYGTTYQGGHRRRRRQPAGRGRDIQDRLGRAVHGSVQLHGGSGRQQSHSRGDPECGREPVWNHVLRRGAGQWRSIPARRFGPGDGAIQL